MEGCLTISDRGFTFFAKALTGIRFKLVTKVGLDQVLVADMFSPGLIFMFGGYRPREDILIIHFFSTGY